MKKEKLRKRLYAAFLASASFFGLLLTGIFTVFPPASQHVFALRKPLTGALFSALCVLGMVAVFFPSKCSESLSIVKHVENTLPKQNSEAAEERGFQRTSNVLGVKLAHGHHPLCEGFAHHEFQIGSKTFCVACMGLFSGASATLPAAAAYFFFGWSLENAALPFLILGFGGVAFILAQYLFFELKNRVLRFSLNAFFVFSSFLVLAAADMAAKSFLLNMFVLGYIVFWLYTRIVYSKLRHMEICESCGFKCATAR